MSSCISLADEYRDKMVQVVQSKKATIVAFFFIYIAFVITLIGKHCFLNNKNEKLKYLNEKLSLVYDDMVSKSFFIFLLILLVTQVKPTIFGVICSYFYIAALAVQVLGALLFTNDKMRKLRLIGYFAVFIIMFFLYWALLINDWCNMLFFSKFFSLKYAS